MKIKIYEQWSELTPYETEYRRVNSAQSKHESNDESNHSRNHWKSRKKNREINRTKIYVFGKKDKIGKPLAILTSIKRIHKLSV